MYNPVIHFKVRSEGFNENRDSLSDLICDSIEE